MGGIDMRNRIAIVIVLAMVIVTLGVKTEKAAIAADSRSASNLVFDGKWGGDKWITETNSEHWYKLVIPSDGCLTLKVMSYIEGYYGTCYWLYNQEFSTSLYEEATGGGSSSQPKTSISNFVLSAGIYYLKVWGDDNTGKYKMCPSFVSYGTNDKNAISYDSPQSYSLGTQIVGGITPTDKEDWYKIVIPKSAYYVLNMKSYIEGYYGTCYWLYNADLSKTLYEDASGGGGIYEPKTKNSEYVLDKGTYYLKVWGDGNNGKYIFNLANLTQANCNHEYESKLIESTYLSKGYEYHKCQKCGKTYKDNYSAKKLLSQGYIWSFGLLSGKKKIKISYQSIADVSGYQIRYSTDRKFKKNTKIAKVGKNTTVRTIKKLRSRKKYYVQVRGYKKVKGKTVYGKWSGKRSVKTK